MGEYSEAAGQQIDAACMSRYNEIFPKLPNDLRTLAVIGLNDANCKRFARHIASGLVELTLRVGDGDGLFDFLLRYEEATLLSQDNGLTALISRSREEIGTGIPSGGLSRIAKRAIKSGDTQRAQVLYDEVDITESGMFEHRMLLWPYGEVLIRFSGFSLTRTPVSSWDAP